MLGVLIGFGCAIGLYKLARHHHAHERCGDHPRERGPCGPRRQGRRWRRGPRFMRPRRWLYPLFERLETTPGQEKLIRREVEDLLEATYGLRRELFAGRGEIATALRAESFEPAALDALHARHEERLADVRKTIVEALGRVHDALDGEQRERLADLIEGGGRGRFAPYRE